MGFFDALKKIAGAAAKEIGEAAKEEAQSVSENKNGSAGAQSSAKPSSAAAAPQKKTPPEIIASGTAPAKSSVERKTEFFGGEEGDDEFDVTFMLSGDFIEFNSHCEIDPSFQYEPYSDREFTGYEDNLPQIGFGPNDDVYDAVERFVKDGTESGREFVKCDSKYFLFRAKFPYGDRILCAYAFSPGTSMEYQMLGLDYLPDVVGTPLEKKLIAALDEAASTYSEVKADS